MMRVQSARSRLLAIAAAALLVLPLPAGAQHAPGPVAAYPSKPVRIIIPLAAGGSSSVVARVFGDYLLRRTGQPAIVENRSGGAGVIGSEAVARAAPDGYTLGVFITSQIVLNPLLQKEMPLDPLTDLVPIAPIGDAPQVLVIDARLPAGNLAEFIAYARQNPNRINYVSIGPGSTMHLAAAQFARLARIDAIAVQYRGAAPGITDLVAGHVQMASVGLGPVAQLLRNKSLRALVTASPTRLPGLPDIPTSAEAGLPGYEMSTWFGVFAPRGTPPAIVLQLNQYARELVADPVANRRLADSYIDPLSMPADRFAAFVAAEARKWERIVKETELAPR